MASQTLVAHEIERIVLDAAEEYDEDTDVVVGLVVVPTPGNPEVPTVAIAIYLAIPGAILGGKINTTAILEPLIEPDRIKDVVGKMMASVREGRSQQLAQANSAAKGSLMEALGQPPEPSSNGLVVPGH